MGVGLWKAGNCMATGLKVNESIGIIMVEADANLRIDSGTE